MKPWFSMALVALVFGLAGCETESSDQIAISITPNNVTMAKGESREFTASGWRDYTWSLSNTSIGVLSTTKGNSTVYTAISGSSSSNSTLTQILSVTVNLAADAMSVGSTNVVPGSSGGYVTAQALIAQTP